MWTRRLEEQTMELDKVEWAQIRAVIKAARAHVKALQDARLSPKEWLPSEIAILETLRVFDSGEADKESSRD